MNSLRLQLRFLLPLVLTLIATAYLVLPLMDSLTLRWFSRDLNLRGSLVASALSDSIAENRQDFKTRRLQTLIDRAAQDERLVGIALCSIEGEVVRRTAGFPASLTCEKAREIAGQNEPRLKLEGGSVQVGMHPINDDNGRMADLVILHDLSFLERRSQDTQKYLIILIASLGLAMTLITVVVAQLSWRGWVAGARALLRGEGVLMPMSPMSPAAAAPPELAPLAADLAPDCATWKMSTAAPRDPMPNGTLSGCARCCARSFAATRSSWCPTANPTSTKRARTA